MVFLKLIPNFYLQKREDRFGPLIITIIFYTWFFINLYHNPDIPLTMRIWTLGSLIAVSIAFFLNVFTKVSLHMVGIGGLLGLVFLLFWRFGLDYLQLGNLNVHLSVVISFILILSGLVGSSRLFLNAHHMRDVYGGAIVGVASQLLALRFLV